jgi:DNA helicase IV
VPETPDHILTSERDHLADSRAALRQMREHTARLTAIGGDHVSTEHLKQTLYRRMQALQDDPEVPLFFGRLDYDSRLGAEQDETLYIGRRHVTGEAGGEPLVIDWRAGMSLPFYRARPGDPMGVRLRRRFGFAHGRLTAYEDEDLTRAQPLAVSDILASELERPRTGPMRDIVATIQPEQDTIVRAGLAQSLCVQGAPGTGKTAVGLHRAAYLL